MSRYRYRDSYIDTLYRVSQTLSFNHLRASDALRHYRLIPDDALKHFFLGVLDIPVMGRFPA